MVADKGSEGKKHGLMRVSVRNPRRDIKFMDISKSSVSFLEMSDDLTSAVSLSSDRG